MATYEAPQTFYRRFSKLTPAMQTTFKDWLQEELVPALNGGPPYPAKLGIKRVQGTPDIWEAAFASDGRATFKFGNGKAGSPHVIWLNIGKHENVF